MIKLFGKVKARYRGEYTDRNGEVHNKIVYSVSDDDGTITRITDFQCEDKPFSIDQEIDIPVRVSCYVKDGVARYTLSMINNDAIGNLTAF